MDAATLLRYLAYFWGALVQLVILLHLLAAIAPARLAPRLAFYARSITAWATLVVSSSYGVVASIVLRVAGYGGLSQWTTGRAYKWLMGFTTGVWFDVFEGEEYLLERPAVFVGNHQTELDVLLLGAMFPRYCSVTAKKSLMYLPILGWFMALSKTVFIDRANRTTAMAAFDGAARHMRDERQSVFIFPEGTRSYTDKPELLGFKKGAFHLAIQAQVPIVPVVSANYSAILSIKRRIFRSGTIKIKVLPPIPTKGLTAANVEDLMTRTRDAMLSTLEQLSRRPEVNGTMEKPLSPRN